jgi:plastocyanin
MADTVLAVPRLAAAASTLTVTVVTSSGTPLDGAVVVAEPASGAPRPQPGQKAVMDQRELMFVPDVLVVQTGTAVDFPNSDQVRHQVYSFSPAKRFELPLYAGTPAKPIVFDKPGVVVLGCNIHDWMIGYIYVSESPYFAKTGADGKLVLGDLPAQAYRVRAWHPRLQGPESATGQTADLGGNGRAELSWKLVLKPEIRIRRAPVPGMRGHY